MEATSASCTEAPPPHPALELPWFLELVAALLPARDVVNLSLAGGMALLRGFGAGRFSVDAMLRKED